MAVDPLIRGLNRHAAHAGEFGRPADCDGRPLDGGKLGRLHTDKAKHCFASCQALLARQGVDQNQAMLTGRGAAFGQRLREALRRAKVSNAAAAKACDISTSAVSSWFKTGRITKGNLRIVAGLAGVSVDDLLSDGVVLQVDVAAKTEVVEVELPRDAIDLARSWLVLPENERNEFRRKIETAALRYRDHVSDERMRTWGNERAHTSKKPPKGGTQ